MDGVVKPTQDKPEGDRYQLNGLDRAGQKERVERPTSRARGTEIRRRAEGAAEKQGAALARSERLQRIRQNRLKREKGSQEGETSQEATKKMTGPVFWFMCGIALLKDFLDVFLTFTVLLSILIIPFTFLFSFCILFYYFYSDVKPSMRKIITIGLSMLIELLPLLGIFPTTFVSLILVRYFENNENAAINLAEKVDGKLATQ